jgi:hypothetical protein
MREPKRSSSQPPGSCAITYDQPNAEKMKPICTWLRCIARAMAGPAIAIAARSA